MHFSEPKKRFKFLLLSLTLCFSFLFSGMTPSLIRAEEEGEDPIGDFVTRAYTLILEREPEEEGFLFWKESIVKGERTAADLVNEFMISEEFRARDLRQEQQMDIIYHVMFDRDPDEAGISYWLFYLDCGVSISAIINGFTHSEEFTTLCKKYNIVPGEVKPIENRDLNLNVTAYVARAYNIFLERKPEVDGLNYWTGRIAKGEISAAEIVNNFVKSEEFRNKGLSQDEELALVYLSMFDREIDDSGKTYWSEILNNGVSISYVINQIACLDEFSALCAKYGMLPGAVELTCPRDKNYPLTAYLAQGYPFLTNRQATAEELDELVASALNGSRKVEDLIKAIVAKEDCWNYLSDNEAFLRAIYRVTCGKEATDSQINSGSISLNNGITRYHIVTEIAKTADYKARLAEMGIANIIAKPEKVIALTWDDGPNAPVTNRILDVLEKYGAHGTFFVVGNRCRTYRSCLIREVNLDCEIGNHTWDHTSLTKLSADGIRSQISQANDAVFNITGIRPKIMRPVGGAFNNTVRNNVGMPMIIWSVDTNDWKYRNAQHVIDEVLSHARDGEIVLMHDLYTTTADAVEVIVPELIARGYTLVTVSELAEYRGVEMENGGAYFSMRG
ncbi:MAG: DUF4214 domain-containing protein [Clostridiales bacterium]|nr:DUF4214 domain-containing protein [Clostridiales bacterium]